jgi:hypothetical protein
MTYETWRCERGHDPRGTGGRRNPSYAAAERNCTLILRYSLRANNSISFDASKNICVTPSPTHANLKKKKKKTEVYNRIIIVITHFM